MLHPDTALQYIDPVQGLGVVATAFIPRGTVVWVRDALDRTLSPADAARLPAPLRSALDRYSYVDRDGDRVLCWDHARYVNHSCRPNCLSPGWEFEIAVRDVEEGEQLTDDYGCLNLIEPLRCACASADCRGRVDGQDFARLWQTWDEALQATLPLLRSVAQPLWELIGEVDQLERVLDGTQAMPSSIEHLWCPSPMHGDATGGRSALGGAES